MKKLTAKQLQKLRRQHRREWQERSDIKALKEQCDRSTRITGADRAIIVR